MLEKQFNLRYFEMNKWGEASPLTMASLIQETASDHCNSIDYGLFDLYAQNIGWVLLASFIKMDRYPVFKENITIRTWVSAFTATRCYRENIIYDAEKNIIGKSRGLWVFFDTQKKRPVRIFDEIIKGWAPNNETCVYYNIDDRLAQSEATQCRKSFDIYQYDLDANNHVNNLRYLQWALETVPENYFEEKQLLAIDTRFIKEAYYGQSVQSVTACEEDKHCLHHRIINAGSGDLCAAANTAWRQRVAVAENKVYQFV